MKCISVANIVSNIITEDDFLAVQSEICNRLWYRKSPFCMMVNVALLWRLCLVANFCCVVRGQICSCDRSGGCNFSSSCRLNDFCRKENVAIGKPANMSSMFKRDSIHETAGPACLAVNGNTDTTFRPMNKFPDSPNCVHTNDNDYNPTWQVDLGRNYTIHNLTVYHRKIRSGRMSNVTVKVDDQLCYTFPDNFRDNVDNTEFKCYRPLSGSSVKFTKSGDKKEYYYINFCELQVWVCKSGLYGEMCDRMCSGHCKNQDQCDNYFGTCPAGCEVGYYGSDCGKKCGHCTEGTTCNIEGECLFGCQNRWSGIKCDVCKFGYYGPDCGNKCSYCREGTICNTESVCLFGCQNRWSGIKCDGCEDGYYGSECGNKCGHCTEGTTCNIYGVCLFGCQNGWSGTKCDECTSGRFGDNCQETCGFCALVACHKHNGTCLNGCVSGFHGDMCKEPSQVSWLVPVICAIIGGFIVLTTGVSLTVCYCRKKNSRPAGRDQSRGIYTSHTSNTVSETAENQTPQDPLTQSEHNTNAEAKTNPRDTAVSYRQSSDSDYSVVHTDDDGCNLYSTLRDVEDATYCNTGEVLY